jgi:hypothetical protein
VITLTLTAEEARNIAGLIDIALKHPQAGGVAIVVPAVGLLQKIEAASKEIAAPQQQE